MVLTERNSGKYLSRRWHRERERAHERPSDYTDTELEWLELTRAECGTHEPELYRTETQPIGDTPFRDRRERIYDLRDRPGAGGRD